MIPLYEFCNKTDQAVSLLNDTGSVPANTCQNVDQENYTFLLSCGVPADCFTLIPPIDLGDLENLTLDVAKF